MALVLTASAPSRRGLGNPLADVVRDRALTHRHRPYLVDARSDRTVSYGDLAGAVSHWQSIFEASGVAPGATVAVAVADPLEFSALFLALMASGRWAAPLDPGLPVAGAGGLIAAASRLEADHVVADRGSPARCGLGWTDARSGRPSARGARRAGVGAGGSSGAAGGGVVLSSSGTTGQPKVIPLAQGQLLHVADAVGRHHGLTSVDRGFSPLPLFHINAEVVGLLATLLAGATLVLDDRFHRTDFWLLMAQQEVTWINAVPAIIALLAEPGPGEVVPPGIRFIRSASAPLPPVTLTRFEANTGITVLETYGMTEAASQITANPLSGVRKPGSVGRPVAVEVRIVPDEDPTSQPASVPAIGHVEIRGPSVITAYGQDGHDARIDADGWLRTGDLGHLDADGYLYLDGRLDDVINRGGEKILPREVEEAILLAPGVVAVAVVGETHPVLGQIPVAFLVVRGVHEESDRAALEAVLVGVRRHLQSALGPSKRPDRLRVVARLPLGATGKVQRRRLAEVNVLGRLAGR